jgi:hypothetical protein
MNTLPGKMLADEPSGIKPMAASQTPDEDLDRDHAKKGWNIVALERMVSDCENQPNYWRHEADTVCAYIDGKQFTPEQEIALRAEGLTDIKPTNLIGRVIRGILGQEAKSRTDVKVEADDEDDDEVCEVMNMAMKEARREAKVDMAVSGAYAGQVGPGLGWVKVDRDQDPLNYPHRCRVIDRRKIWWDWEAQDPLIRDARWLAHKEWADLDELEAVMPQHRQVLRNAANGWNHFGIDTTDYDIERVEAFSDFRRYSRTRSRNEWFDSGRRRIMMYEVWYRVPAVAVVFRVNPTRWMIYDETNQAHIAAVVGGAEIRRTTTSQVRVALFAGPHRLQDVGTTRRNFPYVPFFGYRDDEDRAPYGVGRGMLGPQDEYNARRLRINWMLRARQIIMDHDALHKESNSLVDIADAIMRPDLTVVLNANRTNAGAQAFRVENNLSMQREQIDVMQDAKQLIQDVPGVYGSQLGQAQSGVTSGIANSLLIEQGAVAMGDLNDNYRDSRALVHEILLDQLIEDHKKAGLVVKIGRGSTRRKVMLNIPGPDGTIVNNVPDAAVRVGMGDIPNTPSYRMMQQQQVASVIQAIAQASPQAAGVMVPGFIEMTDLSDRMERADDVRRAFGMPTAGDKQKQAEMEQQQQAQAAKDAQVKEMVMGLEMEDKAAKVQETRSKTELNQAKVVQLGHDMAAASLQQDQPKTAANDPEAERARLIEEAMAEAAA